VLFDECDNNQSLNALKAPSHRRDRTEPNWTGQCEQVLRQKLKRFRTGSDKQHRGDDPCNFYGIQFCLYLFHYTYSITLVDLDLLLSDGTIWTRSLVVFIATGTCVCVFVCATGYTDRDRFSSTRYLMFGPGTSGVVDPAPPFTQNSQYQDSDQIFSANRFWF